jgi:pimeloyl-ACP methyl ester carboxylesterase
MDGQAVLTCERVVRIGEEPSLTGILTEPVQPGVACSRLGVLLLNAGILHDVGPSRLYVQLARSLAAEGHLVLRFDFAGVGDSELRQHGLSFEQSAVLQTQQAMDFLMRTRGLHRFVAGGICSGAVTAARVALADERIAGLALLNPQSYFSTSSAAIGSLVQERVQKNYLLRVSMRSRESWLRLLRGDVDLRPVVRILATHLLRPVGLRRRERGEIRALAHCFDAMLSRGVRILQLYAAGDPGLVELALLTRSLPMRRRADPNLRPILMSGVDHLFTPLHGQRQVLATMRDWLGTIDSEQARSDSPTASSWSLRARANRIRLDFGV